MDHQSNILLMPVSYLEQGQAQIDYFDQLHHNAQAIHFYLTHTLSKSFRVITPHFQQQLLLKKLYFERLRNHVLLSKTSKTFNLQKVNAIIHLRQYGNCQALKRKRQDEMVQKMMAWKKKALVREWKITSDIEHHQRILFEMRKKQQSKEFLSLLTEHKKVRELKVLQIKSQLCSSEVYYQKILLEKSFSSLNLHRKSCKLQKLLRSVSFPGLLQHARSIQQEEMKKIALFRKKLMLSQYFKAWKESFHTQLADSFRIQILLHRYFHQWKNNLEVFVSEREIQSNNQRIAEIYFERIGKNQMKLAFEGWAKWTQETQQSRRKNSILNTFADKKRKYFLLSRYFHMLKQNCINNKIRVHHYEIRLKLKALDGFKIFFREAVAKEALFLQYTENHLVKRCFAKIKQFNNEEQEKVRKFRLQKTFSGFTGNIIGNYCLQNDLALNYYHTNLLYKTLFGLKRERTFRQQEAYLIGVINVILPLRRWVKGHRVRQYLGEKEWFTKRQIFREWKLRSIRKDSAAKLVKEFRESSPQKSISDSKMEEFQFENIMSTIAKIKINLEMEKQETLNVKEQRINSLSSQNLVAETPSRQMQLEYSLDKV